jgi:hypothetical protein
LILIPLYTIYIVIIHQIPILLYNFIFKPYKGEYLSFFIYILNLSILSLLRGYIVYYSVLMIYIINNE